MRLALASSAAALILLIPGIGRAQFSPIEIAFDDCPGGAAASISRVDDCGSNVGVAMDLVVSFVPPFVAPGETFSGAQISIRFLVRDPLPDWWRMGPGDCRAGSFTSYISSPDPEGPCSDPWAGSVPFTSAYYQVEPGVPGGLPAHPHVTIDVGVDSPVALTPGTKYSAAGLRIRRNRSTGPDACAGCCEGSCILLEEVLLYTASGYSYSLRSLRGPFAYWQSAGPASGDLGCSLYGSNCAVSTRRGTWGELKTLYR